MVKRNQEEKKRDPGCLHLYYGDGKGKTTAAMGLAIRAAGAGKQVLIYQFLKDNSSSERKVLDTIPGITCIKGPDKVKFIRNMTQEEKEGNRRQNDQKLEDIIKIAGEYDVLLLDEALYAIGREQLSEELLIRYLKERPWWQEVILTGRDPSREMRALADYCTHIQKEKHPFDQGLCSRKGIEY
ncbi:MAG: cob(I)yrinic acid a,c-diamide adenosyltransferase [Anaerostipes sp.]|nr:cob(I)yrinic acid a,c-diamide adenosyltransferase [Anaerostipes sp.]